MIGSVRLKRAESSDGLSNGSRLLALAVEMNTKLAVMLWARSLIVTSLQFM